MIAPGDTLANRFELRRRIGSGGMGEVYEAFDRDTAEVVALKTLARADGETVTRFKREFRALQSTSHPNLVNLRELVRDGDQWFLTMELVKGRHFLEYVKGDVEKLRAALQQLVQGLRVLHEGGLIHRDIKPSNVMVNTDGRVVLLDFGLVTALDPTRQSTEGRATGTVEYMAPEQAVGQNVTEAADWYAVGVMLYEALTGDVPHTGHPLQIMITKQQSDPRPVAELAPDAPADLRALCQGLLAIEPERRPSGAEIARRLGIDEGAGERATPISRGSGRRVFIGRERELAELADSLERARERPIVHLVIGESGIGKSELVTRFTRRIHEDDQATLILNGRCYERESVPYKAFDGVADGLAQHLAHLPGAALSSLLPETPSLLVRLFPVFLRLDAIASVPAPRQGAMEPQEQRRRMFESLRQLLGAISATRRVVITIDDLQWADADSFLLLRELLRGDDAPRVLVLATVRNVVDADTLSLDEMLAELADVTVRRTALGPLTEDESRALAEKLAPALVDRVDVARVTREARGHPMFLHEILRHLDTLEDGTGTATLDAALTSRVAMLRDDARALLELVCIAGAPISLEVASSACKLDGTTLARAIASLRVATLAREVQRSRGLALEPYHDRVRESVSGRIPEAQRRELHARLAIALEASGEQGNPQLLLRHFRLAELPERAARYAEEAAARSLAAHAFDQAARLWKTALNLSSGDATDRRRLLLKLGEALVSAGRGAEAAEVYVEAAEGADRATRLDCHRHVAEQLLISGRIERGVASLQALLAEIGVRAPATPKAALASLFQHRALLRLRGYRFKERDRSEISDAEILRLDVLQIASKGLSMVDTIRGADFQTRQLILALRSGSRTHIAHAMCLEATFQATRGNVAQARRLFARAIELAGDNPDAYMTGLLQGGQGIAAYFAGDAPRAYSLLLQAEVTMRDLSGANWEIATMKMLFMFVMRVIGDYRGMRERYRQYAVEAQQRGDRYVESTMRRVCVPMWLADDNPAEGLRELARATWVPATTGYHVQHFHELIGRGEIALYTGEPADEAALQDGMKRLESSLLLRITSIRIQYEYLLGRLALAKGGAAKDVERYARKLSRADNAVARVWGHVLRAGVAIRAGDTARAEKLVATAEQTAIAAGMKLTAAACRLRLGQLRRDDAILTAAAMDMDALGVRVPAKMAALLIPTGKE
ncbi:MAG TPA: protein kinase [Kofleriaceae bacterium]|nr:protein kinase [Kofleriaceae bacterium]